MKTFKELPWLWKKLAWPSITGAAVLSICFQDMFFFGCIIALFVIATQVSMRLVIFSCGSIAIWLILHNWLALAIIITLGIFAFIEIALEQFAEIYDRVTRDNSIE